MSKAMQDGRPRLSMWRVALLFLALMASSAFVLVFVSYSYTESIVYSRLQDARMWVQLAAAAILPFGITNDEYSCYETALDWSFGGTAPLRISRITEWSTDRREIPRWRGNTCFGLVEPSSSMVASFEELNRGSAVLRGRDVGGGRHQLIGPSTIAEEHIGRSPDYVTVSRIAFDEARSSALVYLARICGGTCGSGRYLLLERTADSWEAVDECADWVG